MKQVKVILVAALAVFGLNSVSAQDESSGTALSEQEEIAQKLQNPLASIIALPIQHNIGTGVPGYEGSTYTMLLQPIIATDFNKFSIVHRGVFGASYLPASEAGDGSVFGMTDLNYSFFLAPKTGKKLAWGVGPSVDLPTATDQRLGSGKWSAGAGFVMVYQQNKWTFDMVFRQTMSFAGDSERADVSRFVGQTLVAYGLGNGWIVNTFPTITANWNAESGQKWTIPVGGGISKLVFLGKMPVSFGAQYYNNVVRPDYAGKSEFRFSTTFVFAK
ncbi:hypothetical protein OU798_14575 [Prolixibacteraceae bacterium Z1-6]|uniref:Transporter n=1 Tax=Draconibacterium aestuarii TaxID=2998507 RepID=A0A9X3F6U6_9BACT|nr:hypothetical protein [Prolixibacteraceae bacterium Z1-6]